MKVAIIGTGYVGLVSGTCLAEAGNDVVCIDNDKNKVKNMQRSMLPIYEPQLEEIFKRNIEIGRLKFTESIEDGVYDTSIIFLALPTPSLDNKSTDLSHIFQVAEQLGPLLKKYTVIINKSTAPVGTTEQIRSRIASTTDQEFDVISNPEFLREGFAVSDFMFPDRVVIGTDSRKARSLLVKLYEPFLGRDTPVIYMSEKSAEMTKYAANTFLATKLSFINEIANLCELTGADIDSVRLGMATDARIGNRYLSSGIGYGGGCLPKDARSFKSTSEEYGYNFKILDSVISVNDMQKKKLISDVISYYGNVSGKKIALWGLSFKPDTDDVREAASLDIIRGLIKNGALITAYDPVANVNAEKELGKLKALNFVNDAYEALEGANALIIATEWAEFRRPEFTRMKQLLQEPVIFDGRNLYDVNDMRKLGFYYKSIGRETVIVKV